MVAVSYQQAELINKEKKPASNKQASFGKSILLHPFTSTFWVLLFPLLHPLVYQQSDTLWTGAWQRCWQHSAEQSA
jgi:hypothetical protein